MLWKYILHLVMEAQSVSGDAFSILLPNDGICLQADVHLRSFPPILLHERSQIMCVGCMCVLPIRVVHPGTDL